MTTSLPRSANLSHVKKQAKELLRAVIAQDADAVRLFAAFHPRWPELGRGVSLHDAQLVIARQYGFESWPKLRAFVSLSSASPRTSPILSKAFEELRRGRPIILFDDEGRENEGDLVLAASQVTPEAINFVTKHGRGTLCLALTQQQVRKLGLPLMAPRRDLSEPAFTLSIDAASGITTGVSTSDRARTIRAAVSEEATAATVRSPGHVFPLQAEPGGVLARPGHTEGSVDLMRLAGLAPAAVICEILAEDGSMARWLDLVEISRRLGLVLLKMTDIVAALEPSRACGMAHQRHDSRPCG